MAKAKMVIRALTICGAMLLGVCGAQPSTSTDRESTVSAASDISAEPSLVPFTFEKNVRATVLGVQVKFDENEKLKDLLDKTGLTLGYNA